MVRFGPSKHFLCVCVDRLRVMFCCYFFFFFRSAKLVKSALSTNQGTKTLLNAFEKVSMLFICVTLGKKKQVKPKAHSQRIGERLALPNNTSAHGHRR